MLLDHLFLDEKYWFVPLILQAIAYVGVLKKMGIGWLWAFIPGGADYQLTRKLYPRTRTFWRPFFVMMLPVDGLWEEVALCRAYDSSAAFGLGNPWLWQGRVPRRPHVQDRTAGPHPGLPHPPGLHCHLGS